MQRISVEDQAHAFGMLQAELSSREYHFIKGYLLIVIN